MPASDLFPNETATLTTPAERVFAITPHDTNELNFVTRALHVGGAGTLAVVSVAGDQVTFTCSAGELLPIRIKQVKATGTTATNLVGLC